MSVFDKWKWIKRNWSYVIEEASQLNLVFVGGTALNVVLLDEYRASEDIDLYDPNADDIGSSHEEKMVDLLIERLTKKGLIIKLRKKHTFWIGPNIKIDVFNNGTNYESIKTNKVDEINVLLFDTQTYMDMKLHSLLCRSLYDARDLVDIFKIKSETKCTLTFPKQECNVIEHKYLERIEEIKNTSKKELLVFQTHNQISNLPYEKFDEFKEWIYDWLSRFC